MHENQKSIAILLAAYNAEKYIVEQIDSIIAQTNQDWTLYIRNDGSTDSTAEIIEKYYEKYPDRIIEIDKGGKNLGCRNNFFRLFEVVDSEYYMFCDQDDIWLPQKIEISLKEIQSCEQRYSPATPILAFCDSIICDENMNIISSSFWKSSKINPVKLLSYNYMAISCPAAGASSILNKSVKSMLIPIAENDLIYDYWIAISVAKYGKLHVITQPLRYYRQHGDQVSGITVGQANTIKHKLLNYKTLLKQYRFEARHHSDFGYGSHMKYYWYKMLTILKTRLSRYR